MRRKAGILCVILGIVMLCGAGALQLHNQNQDEKAGQAAAHILPLVQAQIAPEPTPERVQQMQIPKEYLEPEDLKMTEVIIDGNPYIGFLSIPSLSMELPVLSQWSYELLEIAPCRYSGTLRGEDLVIMAHNYHKHFGDISELAVGDRVSFSDMDGMVTEYEVAARDVLVPEAVEEITAGDYDLTLFTCTYGGQSRVAVYCDAIS